MYYVVVMYSKIFSTYISIQKIFFIKFLLFIYL